MKVDTASEVVLKMGVNVCQEPTWAHVGDLLLKLFSDGALAAQVKCLH